MMRLNLLPTYLNAIILGTKTVEGRLAKPEYLALKPKDRICFTDTTGKCYEAEVLKVRKFSDFKSMIETSTLQACLPGVTSIQQGVDIYRSFPGYKESEKTLGVVAIHIKKQGN